MHKTPRSRLNQQLLSGAKAELAQRLAENAILGALAPCPSELGDTYLPQLVGEFCLNRLVEAKVISTRQFPKMKVTTKTGTFPSCYVPITFFYKIKIA